MCVAACLSFLCGVLLLLDFQKYIDWYKARQKHQIERTPVVGFCLLGGPNADSIIVGSAVGAITLSGLPSECHF